MTATPTTFREAWISDLKSQPTLVSFVGQEIREIEYQATDWVYPNIRVSLEFLPSINRCGPDDANVELSVYSEEKSSKQASDIASEIMTLYHGVPFEANNIKFSTVIVRKVSKPDRSIFAWLVKVEIFCQGV